MSLAAHSKSAIFHWNCTVISLLAYFHAQVLNSSHSSIFLQETSNADFNAKRIFNNLNSWCGFAQVNIITSSYTLRKNRKKQFKVK